MKKGINQWAFSAGTTVSQAIRKAKQAGFDSIELCFEEKGEISFDSKPDMLSRIVSEAGSVGIEIASVATGILWRHSLTSDDPALRDKGKQAVKAMLKIARELGTDAILVVPGATMVPWMPEAGVVPYETALQRARDAIGELVKDAEKARVVIGLENVWNGMFLSPLELRDFVDSFGSEYVGAYFDVGNCVLTGRPEDWIHILGSRITRVHMKDFRIAAGMHGFVGLLEGDVNWQAVMAALKEIGYNGHLIAELGPYKYAPDVVLDHVSRSLDAIRAMG